MPVKHYEKLTQYLYVNEPQANSPDELARIQPILESVLERYRVVIKSSKTQSIDEAMIPYKGRFLQSSMFHQSLWNGISRCGWDV